MNEQKIHTYTFHVNGMHCKACEHLVESELGVLDTVASVHANLSGQTVQVSGVFEEKTETEIAELLTASVAVHGYTVSTEKGVQEKKWSEFLVAFPIAIVFLGVFVFLQKTGLVHFVGTDTMTYGTVFVIGIIASLSSCMAVVGGLLLSLSATFAKEGNSVIPQTLFHGGRIVSFFLLGGVIGMLGTAFTLSAGATFVLDMAIGIVMLILGFNLLDVYQRTRGFQIAMPRFISRHAFRVSKLNHTLTPLLAGVATFFLPCGFTQSMQLYALGTGGFLNGGLTMLAFALGTFPVLALISASSLSIQESPKKGIFFKTAGLIVIAFALMNIINSFVIMGALSPVFTF